MSPQLKSFAWCEYESEVVETMDFLGGEVAFYTSRCPSKAGSANEDAACVVRVSDSHGLIAVADGVGGNASGNEAARCVIECLCKEAGIDPEHAARGLRSGVMDAIEHANREILSWGIGAATTLTVIELFDGEFRHFHVGDTGALVTSNRGNIKFATVGHAPIAQALEIGLLDEAEAMAHEDKNVITNCVGSLELRVEIGTFQNLAVRDTLLLASDGVLDNVSKEQVVRTICKGHLGVQVSRLVELANKGMSVYGKEDDLTLICWRPKRKQRKTQAPSHPGSSARCDG